MQMVRSTRALLIASMITTTHAQTRAYFLNGSTAVWITSTQYSRSPNEYLEYNSIKGQCIKDEHYSIGDCVKSHVIDGAMPSSAVWWLIPEDGTKDPQWVHIVAGRESSWAGYMLGPFVGSSIYPNPYWLEDADFARRNLVWSRYKIEATTVDGEELVQIIIGNESHSKANEMLFLNRNIGDWLDTWGVDRNDTRAMWRFVPVPCRQAAYANSCELPDFQAAWSNWKRMQWIPWAITGGVLGFCCLCGCLGALIKDEEGTSIAVRSLSRTRQRREPRSDHTSSEMGVVRAQPVVATTTAVPVYTFPPVYT